MMIPNTKIDGITLKKMMITAASNLEQTKEEINAINVFPIPDGDTGVNLFLTIRTVVEQFNEINPSSIQEAAQLITKQKEIQVSLYLNFSKVLVPRLRIMTK